MTPHLDRLVAVRDWMAEEPDHAVTLAAAADRACLSPFHFQRLFKRAFGVSPQEHLEEVRLKRAKLLLATTTRTFGDICTEVGMASRPTFARRFRERFGQSPGQYRRAVRRVYASSHKPPTGFIPWCCLRRFAPDPESQD